MSAVVFDGSKFALKREKALKKRVKSLGFAPKVVSIFFAEDGGSVLYTNLKQQAAGRVGVHFHPEELSIETPMLSVQKVIRHYSREKNVQGIMVQKPKIESVAEVNEVGELGFIKWWRTIVEEISFNKDVDCLHPVNLERVYRGSWKIIPATVKAVLNVLRFGLGIKETDTVAGSDPVEQDQRKTAGSDPAVKNKKIAVVGRSELVGKPLAYVLAQKGAEVFLCGSAGLAAKSVGSQFVEEVEPRDLKDVLSESDIVVSATGKSGLIKGEMVKSGSVVIDVGWPIGDVDFKSVKKKSRFVTPVPGGVGPVTVMSLLENLLLLV